MGTGTEHYLCKNYSSQNITYAYNAKFAKSSKDTCWIKQGGLHKSAWFAQSHPDNIIARSACLQCFTTFLTVVIITHRGSV